VQQEPKIPEFHTLNLPNIYVNLNIDLQKSVVTLDVYLGCLLKPFPNKESETCNQIQLDAKALRECSKATMHR
jgi:hypothetical protein